jgi:hypothetical protein
MEQLPHNFIWDGTLPVCRRHDFLFRFTIQDLHQPLQLHEAYCTHHGTRLQYVGGDDDGSSDDYSSDYDDEDDGEEERSERVRRRKRRRRRRTRRSKFQSDDDENCAIPSKIMVCIDCSNATSRPPQTPL